MQSVLIAVLLPLFLLTSGAPQGDVKGLQGLSPVIPRTPSAMGEDVVLPLGGHSQSHINAKLQAIVFGLTAAGAIGWYVDTCWQRSSESRGRPAAWAVAILIVSYGLLVPGWISTIFSCNAEIALNVGGVGVIFPLIYDRDTGAPQPLTESTFGFTHFLAESGSTLGPFLVVLYAVMIPLIKIALLILGEMWRFSSLPERVQWARRSISVVQLISKWASPDMFAYIFMCFLFRITDSGPQPGLQPRIISDGILDTGFTCYCAFCLASTIASLVIKLPEVETHEYASNTESPSNASNASRMRRMHGESNPESLSNASNANVPSSRMAASLRILTMVCSVVALFLLHHGLFLPTMAMRMDMAKQAGTANLNELPVAEIEAMLANDVSFADGLSLLLSRTTERGDLNSALALAMLVVFVVLLTVLDLLVLIRLSCQLGKAQGATSDRVVVPTTERLDSATRTRAKVDTVDRAWRTLEMARTLKHLSMLDVAVMGIYIFTQCAGPFKHDGVIISYGNGLLWLAVAEFFSLHYILCS
eukprot:gnl/TRDRNA2_/TRDRNA2_167344_c0_seq8.p1 gnl/TRDRNA2_/TRDRNA2_167344_c0~~gnl/TRDRNA2_/TRDRNA2_167344_c0_seq8.p1  ORF type:complete len:532 (+),score=27.48 gnl/TRDRNA2_/TRDRNA2_167344_c0_seq8:45-1640(+)